MENKEGFKKLIEQIKQQIKIVDIADEYGLKVLHRDKKIAKLAEYESVCIYQNTNTFYRWSTGVGGDIFRFMQEMPEINLSFQEAFEKLSKKINPAIELQKKTTTEKKVIKTLRDKQERTMALLSQVTFDSENKNIIAYLIKERNIHPSIVYDFIDKDILRQETNQFGYKSAVFLGRYIKAGNKSIRL